MNIIKNKAVSQQPPPEVITDFKFAQGGEKKHYRFARAHVSFGKAEIFAWAIKSIFFRMGTQFPVRK